MDFKAIETQEELDQVLSERLNREKANYEKKLAEFKELKSQNEKLKSDLKNKDEESAKKAEKYEADIADLNSKVASFEKANLRTKIALENNLPLDLADRLVGEDEESLKTDAERLSGLLKSNEPEPPLKYSEDNSDDKDDDYKDLLNNLNTEEV